MVIALGATIFYALSRESALDYGHSKIQPEEDLGSMPDANLANVAGEQHWKYFRNACSCFLDLIFKDCSLMAVQAICGMVQSPLLDTSYISLIVFLGYNTTDELPASDIPCSYSHGSPSRSWNRTSSEIRRLWTEPFRSNPKAERLLDSLHNRQNNGSALWPSISND